MCEKSFSFTDLGPYRVKRRSFVLSACLLLGGCGWHLRGVQQIPLETIYLKFPPNNAMAATMRRSIQARTNVKVVANAADAEAIFELPSMRRGSNVLAYNSEGKARIYELITRAQFRVTLQKNGAEIIPLTTVTAARELNYDERDWNGKAQEEQLLYRNMEQAIIQQIVNAMAHITSDQIEQAQHEL